MIEHHTTLCRAACGSCCNMCRWRTCRLRPVNSWVFRDGSGSNRRWLAIRYLSSSCRRWPDAFQDNPMPCTASKLRRQDMQPASCHVEEWPVHCISASSSLAQAALSPQWPSQTQRGRWEGPHASRKTWQKPSTRSAACLQPAGRRETRDCEDWVEQQQECYRRYLWVDMKSFTFSG